MKIEDLIAYNESSSPTYVQTDPCNLCGSAYNSTLNTVIHSEQCIHWIDHAVRQIEYIHPSIKLQNRNPTNTVYVSQGEHIFTTKSLQNIGIKTTDCYCAIIIRNPYTNQTCIANFTAHTTYTIESITQLFESAKNVDIYILCGPSIPKHQLQALLLHIRTFGEMYTLQCAIIGKKYIEFIVNPSNGSIYVNTTLRIPLRCPKL